MLRVRAFHTLVGFLDALVQAESFQACADDDHDERDKQFHPVHVTQCRIGADRDKLLHRFGRREESTDEEQQRGHDERSKIFGAIQAERMVAVRLALGETSAHHQYDFVGAIRDGMYRLGKHGGRSGEERRAQFRDGDADVRTQRRLDGRALMFGFPHLPHVVRGRTVACGIARFAHCLPFSNV